MSEIKWIKLTTDIFDDEKIRIIESMPDSDSLLIIWVKLLCLAGKVNRSGYIFLTEDIPYTDEMLSSLFGRPLNVVRLALQTFTNMGMLVNQNNYLFLPNWEKHQNIEGMERVREQNRLRQQKKRSSLMDENTSCDVTVTSRDSHTIITQQNKNKNKNIYTDMLIDKSISIYARRIGFPESEVPSRDILEEKLKNENLNPAARKRFELLLAEYKRLEASEMVVS